MTAKIPFTGLFSTIIMTSFLLISGVVVFQDDTFDTSGFKIMDVYVEQNITTEIEWGPVESPYMINSTIWIAQGAKLTILPGTEVKFGEGSSLVVNGSFFAGGEQGRVDLESIGNAFAGSWEGIILGPGSISRFERVNITGANISITGLAATDAVMRNSSITLDNCSFDLYQGSSFRIHNSSLN